MIFNEIYSAYYNAVAGIISSVIEGNTDEKELNKIVSEKAFGESVLTVLPSLKSEKWQLVHKDLTTPIKNKPTMPLTLLQKMWLKAITLDSRFKLFGVKIAGLDGVEPLFRPEDINVYDRYADGDPYEDEEYIDNFQTILKALRERKTVKFEMVNKNGKRVYPVCLPIRLEYSEKDDKFRLVTSGCKYVKTVNLAKIQNCRIYQGKANVEEHTPEMSQDTIVLKVSEERNTLERCLLHFAHFEKRAEKSGEEYLLYINYSTEDEAELVIRVLSFGPTVEVLGSESFKNKIINKLKSQKSCERL